MNNIRYYSNMAKQILIDLGSVYRTDNENDYNAAVEQACSYEG